MAESSILTVIRVWCAVAWADGVLAEAEAQSLRRLIRAADLSVAEREAAMKFLDEQVSLPETYLTTLSPDSRRGIYRAACRLAIVDRVFSDSERATLVRLRDLLGIPTDIATEIEADVPGLDGRA